ncbi:MAG: PAS domain-containing protein [Turneriella sp.]|nr:PAS domain-containing protein [Turneriella sp.]
MASRISFVLFILVAAMLPGFLLVIQDRSLFFYYLVYPAAITYSIYLRYRQHTYAANLLLVIAINAVVVWLIWLSNPQRNEPLRLWILSLLPWVIFEEPLSFTLVFCSLVPVIISLLLSTIELKQSPLLPAEQDFVRQMLGISLAVGAFASIYFLRRQFFRAKQDLTLERAFYLYALNTIPLPIIVKDGITLDFVFWNRAAALTFGLPEERRVSNYTLFTDWCAAAISQLDHEVLRGESVHIEPEEHLMDKNGVAWHFRTYRVPLRLPGTGRKLLLSISEDLRAINKLLQHAEEVQKILSGFVALAQPIFVRYGIAGQELEFMHWGAAPAATDAEFNRYLVSFFSALQEANGRHRFQIAGQDYLLFYGKTTEKSTIAGIIIPV